MTSFSELYKYIRGELGDMNDTPIYSDKQLDKAIATALLRMDGYVEIVDNGDVAVGIEPTLDNRGDDFRLLILYSAWLLIRPQAGSISYRTGILSVDRGGRGGDDPATTLLTRIESDIAILEGSKIIDGYGVTDEWKDFGNRWEAVLAKVV